jgi:N-acetylmuramoyl-L-alanine amidase
MTGHAGVPAPDPGARTGTGQYRRPEALACLALVVLGLTACAGPTWAPAANSRLRTRPPKSSTVGRPLQPSFFAPGSCVAFAPTQGNRHETVFLDAGHGGVDPGAVGKTEAGVTVYEKNLTLRVELDTAALLRAAGFRVVVSRTNAGPVAIPKPGAIVDGVYTRAGDLNEVAARDICANLAKAKVLIGIYFDAGASPANAGCVTGYDPARSFASANLRLAKLLQHAVLTAMNNRGWKIPDEGVLTDEGLGSGRSATALSYGHLVLLGPAKPGYFATPSEMPGALIEPLFLTDPFEASIADSKIGQHTIAGGIALAVEQFLG